MRHDRFGIIVWFSDLANRSVKWLWVLDLLVTCIVRHRLSSMPASGRCGSVIWWPLRLINTITSTHTLRGDYNMPLLFAHHFVSAWFNGAFRLEGHSSPAALSLSHYDIIILDTSLRVECFSFVFVFFVFFVFQADGSILVRNPFSYEHLSQCVHYSWRPITPDWHSSPLKMRERHVWSASVRQTCADHCILRDGLLLCSDITMWLKGF